MLKEGPRFDYVEESAPITEQAWRALGVRRGRKNSGPALPVGMRQLHQSASIPMQSYLQTRFPHIGRNDYSARTLRAENQRRHDLAAARGNWQMSRTS
jgi:hypothetical protein